MRDWRYKDADAYVQDNYSVTKRLTLNLGLRYEHIGDLGEARGLTGNVIVADIDPNPPAAGSYAGYEVASNYHGAAALPAGAVKGSNTFGIEGQGQDTINPRFGFAYLLPGGDSMVLRGGIGLYHATPEGQLNVQLSSEQPFGGFRSLIGTQNAGATDAMPFAPTPVLPSFTPYSPTTTQTLDSLAQNFRPSSTYHYSLGVQTKIASGAILDIAYAGARGLHEILGRSINQANIASPANPIRGVTANTVANAEERAPYLGWTTATMYEFGTEGEAWYDSLQVSLSQNYKNKLQYQASYTWAQLLSPVPGFTLGSNEYGPSGDQNNLHAHNAGYGPEPYIRPQRLVISALYHLPSPGQGHTLLAEALGGWTASTVIVAQDGQQVSIGYNNPNNVYGINGDRPSYATGCDKNDLATKGSVSHRVNNYINAACLTTPAVFNAADDPVATGFGNVPNGVLRGPGQIDADISVLKSWGLHWPNDGANVQFRTDFFNATNHPNFYLPNLSYAPSGTSFGQITSMSTNPRLIQFALRLAF